MNISPNTSALMALNELRKNSDRTQKIMNKAALGEKIASAGDDASNYAISEKMRANIRALNQDIVNASTGNRLIATAESGIHEIVNNLRAIKELAINAANDSNTDADRAIMQKNVDQRLAQIDDIAATTNYNGKYLLNGDYRRILGAAGSGGTDSGDGSYAGSGILGKFTIIGSGTKLPEGAKMKYKDIKCPLAYSSNTTKLKVDFSGLKTDDGTLKYPDSFDGEGFSMGCVACKTYIDIVFDKDKTVSESTIAYESSGETAKYIPPGETDLVDRTVYSYTYTIGIKDVTDESSLEKAFFDGTVAANDKAPDDIAINKPEGAYFGVPWSYTHDVRVSYKDGACYIEGSTRPIWPIYPSSVGDGGVEPIPPEPVEKTDILGKPLVIHTGTKSSQNLHVFIEDMSTKAMGIDKLKITTQEQAKNLLSTLESREKPDGIIDKAIEYALGECTHLGAYYQELEFTQSNLTIQSENTTNAESVIRDADMGETMMEYTRLNILTQASQAMLGQANQNVGSKLDLLQ